MHDYTKILQDNLSKNIKEIIQNEGLEEVFEIKKEKKISVFGNIDIAIYKKNEEIEKPNRILGIEIEVVNQYTQIVKNFDNFKNYVHKSKNRKGGLLQIFSNFANIDTDGVSRLMIKSYKAMQTQKGFYFDFMSFDINHWKAGKMKANEIASHWEFQARFWALMKLVFPKEIKL